MAIPRSPRGRKAILLMGVDIKSDAFGWQSEKRDWDKGQGESVGVDGVAKPKVK